jgi:hypothetical protein
MSENRGNVLSERIRRTLHFVTNLDAHELVTPSNVYLITNSLFVEEVWKRFQVFLNEFCPDMHLTGQQHLSKSDQSTAFCISGKNMGSTS